MNDAVAVWIIGGIRTSADAEDAWGPAFQRLVSMQRGFAGIVEPYYTSWWNRRFSGGNQRRAKRVLAHVREYGPGWKHVLVGHSNGCDIICRLLSCLKDGEYIHQAHLIAPAAEACFEKNGINEALRRRKLGYVSVHYGGRDTAMRWARLSTRLLHGLGLGYGYLGLAGPVNVDPRVSDRVTVRAFETYAHSDFFAKENRNATLASILRIEPDLLPE